MLFEASRRNLVVSFPEAVKRLQVVGLIVTNVRSTWFRIADEQNQDYARQQIVQELDNFSNMVLIPFFLHRCADCPIFPRSILDSPFDCVRCSQKISEYGIVAS